MKWYRLASEGGDKRAGKRLAAGMNGTAALNRRLELEAMKEGGAGGAKGDKDGCLIM
jgi:hypothetical protein